MVHIVECSCQIERDEHCSVSRLFLEKPAAMSAVIVDSVVDVECFCQKPCCAGWKGMCVSIFGCRSISIVFAAGHSRLIGRQFLPGFRIGMIIACAIFQVLFSRDYQIEDVGEIVVGTLSELLEVEGVHLVWSDGCGRFGHSDRFFCVGRRE